MFTFPFVILKIPQDHNGGVDDVYLNTCFNYLLKSAKLIYYKKNNNSFPVNVNLLMSIVFFFFLGHYGRGQDRGQTISKDY